MRGAGRRRGARDRAAQACTVKYDGTDAPLVVALRRRCAEIAAALRGGASPALRLRHAGQAADRRGGLGRGGRRDRRRPTTRSARAACAAATGAAGARRACSRGGAAHEAPVYRSRRAARRRQRSTGPAIIAEATATTVVEPGWRARLDDRGAISCSSASSPLPRRVAIGTRCRSGDARSVQQSLHGDRRADGRRAAEHRLFGQHQGAARFLLRAVRPRRRAHRQRAAHAGASGLDGRERARRSVARARRRRPRHAAGRRLCAERAL